MPGAPQVYNVCLRMRRVCGILKEEARRREERNGTEDGWFAGGKAKQRDGRSKRMNEEMHKEC